MTAQTFDELRNIVNNEMPTFIASSYAEAAPDGERARRFIAAARGITWPHDAAGQWPAKPAQIDFAQPVEQETQMSQSERRMVRVIVVDPDEQVPTHDALLFDSKEMFTDKTDQELFFEIGVQKFLTEHNSKRVKMIDKTVKDRTQNLEPARIRDLKMLVLTLAKF